MAHNRKLVLGGVGLTLARVRSKWSISALNRVRDELEKELIQSSFLNDAPFRWVGVMIRKGLVDETEPHYEKIDQKDGELPLAIEVDVHRLLDVSEEEMVAVYRKATLLALVDAGEKYQRPTARLRELLEELR